MVLRFKAYLKLAHRKVIVRYKLQKGTYLLRQTKLRQFTCFEIR